MLLQTIIKRIISREYPIAESLLFTEEKNADPPQFGKSVYKCKTKISLAITTSVKDFIRDVLKKYNVGSIIPEFVDIDYIYPILTLSVNYDSLLTNKTTSVLRQDVLNSLNVLFYK